MPDTPPAPTDRDVMDLAGSAVDFAPKTPPSTTPPGGIQVDPPEKIDTGPPEQIDVGTSDSGPKRDGAVPGAINIRVSPSHILNAAKVLVEQYHFLNDSLTKNAASLHMKAPAADPITAKAVEGWNLLAWREADSYQQRVRDYLKQLRIVIDNLRTAAIAYQVGEADRAKVFRDLDTAMPNVPPRYS